LEFDAGKLYEWSDKLFLRTLQYNLIQFLEEGSRQNLRGVEPYVMYYKQEYHKSESDTLKARSETFEFWNDVLVHDATYFVDAAVPVRWNKCGYFNCLDGTHRINYLYAKGIFEIPVIMTKQDYAVYRENCTWLERRVSWKSRFFLKVMEYLIENQIYEYTVLSISHEADYLEELFLQNECKRLINCPCNRNTEEFADAVGELNRYEVPTVVIVREDCAEQSKLLVDALNKKLKNKIIITVELYNQREHEEELIYCFELEGAIMGVWRIKE
jgi:hypothetical protein